MKNNARIISISGNPVSGKSTVVNKMIEKLKDKGFSDENIHLISTGTIFRQYFNKIKTLLANIDNDDVLKELATDDFLINTLLNPTYRQKIQNVYISLKKAGIDPSELDIADVTVDKELASIRHILDENIDPEIEKLGKKILEENNPNEVWLIDSRLAFHNIPESFAVRLTVRDDVAAERLFNDTSRGSEDSNYENIEEARKKVLERKEGEQDRYKRRYGIDLENPDNYKLIIDTSYSDVDEIADTIFLCEEYNRNGKNFAKTWASPKIFLPTQSIRETGGLGLGSGMTFEQIVGSIKNNGYNPSKPIEIVDVDGIEYLMEGHHRNFASVKAGKTLIPYTEYLRYPEDTAKKLAKGTPKSYLIDHEMFFDKKKADGTTETFSYNNIYPGIYKLLSRPESPDPHEL